MNFRATVKDGDSMNENSSVRINDEDKKIDTTPGNEEEEKEQNAFEEKMTGGDAEENDETDEENDSSKDEDIADTTGEEEDNDETDIVDNDDGWNANDHFSESEDKKKAKEAEPEKKGEEDQKKETDQKKEPETAFSKADDDFEKLSPTEKEKKYLANFYEGHKDILSPAFKENFDKYYESGNDAFLHLDNNVHRLVTAARKLRDDLPTNERLELAFRMAFDKEISAQERKRGEIDGEVRTQKVNKAASPAIGSSGEKSSNKQQYSPAQEKIMKRWGVA